MCAPSPAKSAETLRRSNANAHTRKHRIVGQVPGVSPPIGAFRIRILTNVAGFLPNDQIRREGWALPSTP